jgi:hypothetical protein
LVLVWLCVVWWFENSRALFVLLYESLFDASGQPGL